MIQVIKVKSNEWCRESMQTAGESIFYEPEYIDIVEKAFNIEAVPYLVYKFEKPLLGMLAYRKGNSIVHPSIYTYTSIWTNGTMFDVQQAYVYLINQLQKEYKAIHIILPPEVKDVRPFIRNRFRISVNYTYLKDLTALGFDSKLKSRERKAISLGIKFKWNDSNADLIEQNRRDFIKYGYGNRHAAELVVFFSALLKRGYAKGVSARLDNKLLASGVILTDHHRKYSSNCLISSEKANYETGVNSGLYIHLYNGLKNDGFISNDLCGANALGGGNFKSNFSNNLVPYYEAKYSYWRNLLQLYAMKLRRILRGA